MNQIKMIMQKISREFLQLDRDYVHQINNLLQQHVLYDYEQSINLLEKIIKESLSLIDILKNSENYQISYQQEIKQIDEIKRIDQENIQPQIQQQAQIPQITQQNEWQQEEAQVKQKNKIKNKNCQIKYKSHFDYSSKNTISTADISPSLKYLAFGGYDNQISIIELESKQLFRMMKLESRAEICKFYIDSTLLLCGDYYGYLYIIDGLYFNLIHKHKISTQSIKEIKFINNETILHYSKKNIIVTNIKQNVNILEIDPQCHSINNIDYEQEKELVCICSEVNDINVFNVQNGDMIIQQSQSHISNVRPQQIQFVNHSNYIVTANQQELILWQMDYKKKQLIKINQISDYKISNFSCVNDGKRIVIVCDKNLLYILNNQLMLNQTVQFKCSSRLYKYHCTQQTDSLNYVIILGQYNISVLRRCDDQ